MENKSGVIKFKGVDYHYYVEGHRGGRNLVVYEVIEEDEMDKIIKMNKFIQNFGTWAFEADKEAKKIIKQFRLIKKGKI